MSSSISREKSRLTLLIKYAVPADVGNVAKAKITASLQISLCAICQKRALDSGGGSYTYVQ